MVANGSTPGTTSGRRTLREAPPPIVLITPMEPDGHEPPNPLTVAVLITTPVVVFWQTTSARVTRTLTGKPLRALRIAPTSQFPRSICAAPSRSLRYFFPLPNGNV